MPLPETLREPLAAARSMIGRAHAFDAGLLTGNANAMLTNAQAFVARDATISETFDAARRQIGAMADARALDDARTFALQAIDALEHSLLRARPNDHARALGMDWF
ncbi:hypothetical protein FHY04_003277 [Sphingomonas sp. BK481]|jgi:hypothetical protein|nr:hypothetical protein [Sphingomonas sp. BK481]